MRILEILQVNENILDKSEHELRKTIRAEITPESDVELVNDQSGLLELASIFDEFGNIEFPLSESRADILVSLLKDKSEQFKCAQIKPLRYLLSLLRDADDSLIRKVVLKDEDNSQRKIPDFQGITIAELIKFLNKILKNPGFYNEESFSKGIRSSSPIKSAVAYFKEATESGHFSIERIVSENRRLIDAHILKLVRSNDASQENEEPGKKDSRNRGKSIRLRKFGKTLINTGLDDDKAAKIVEGIVRFPFSALLFFFTIFICIIYLFAFTFAFHDQAALNTSEKVPALFLAIEYPNKKSDAAVNKSNAAVNANSNSNTNESHKSSLNAIDQSNDNSNSGAIPPPVSDNKVVEDLEKFPTIFFFYAPLNGGIEIAKLKDLGLEDSDSEGKMRNEIEKLEKCAEVQTKFLDDLQTEGYSVKKEKLTRFRSIANKISFCNLFLEITKKSAHAEKIFIEIVGRADDNVVKPGTYSANYELSSARAQNLKFEIVRHFQDSPEILRKIEWTYLPVSNDRSIGGDYPLNNPDIRPTMVNNALSDPNTLKEAAKDFKEDIKTLKTNIPDPAGNKNLDNERPQLNEDQRKLKSHLAKAESLFDKVPLDNLKAGEALYAGLQREAELYEELATKQSDKTSPEVPDNHARKKADLKKLQKDIGNALFYHDQKADNGSKRIAEIYITPVPEKQVITPSTPLTLADYILYSITPGYGDIKPTTIYAKFLSILVSLVQIFFVVVFFNALMSVKRGSDEDIA